MADKISIEGIAYIVERIVERAREAAVESRGDRKDSFKDGRASAYYEVLDILRTELSVREISLEKIGSHESIISTDTFKKVQKILTQKYNSRKRENFKR